MSFKTISLPDTRPRDAIQIKKKLPLHKGLLPFYFLGVFALFLPFLPVVFLAVNGNIAELGWGILILLFLIAESTAFFLLNYANKSYLQRLKAISNGIIIKGKVVEAGKKFVFWKCSRDYNLKIKFEYKNSENTIKLSNPSFELHKKFPLGSEVIGLLDTETGSISFLLEMGLILEDNKNKKPIYKRKNINSTK